MKRDKKSSDKKKNRKKPAEPDNYHSSAIYEKNKKTGQWEVKNPAGSIAYNYLYGNEFDNDQT